MSLTGVATLRCHMLGALLPGAVCLCVRLVSVLAVRVCTPIRLAAALDPALPCRLPSERPTRCGLRRRCRRCRRVLRRPCATTATRRRFGWPLSAVLRVRRPGGSEKAGGRVHGGPASGGDERVADGGSEGGQREGSEGGPRGQAEGEEGAEARRELRGRSSAERGAKRCHRQRIRKN